MLLFLNNNKFIDFEDSFFDDSTDSYIAKRIEFCKIEVSDFKFFYFYTMSLIERKYSTKIRGYKGL